MKQEQHRVWLSTTDLAEDLKRDEGLSLVAYTCPAGKLTIGYGRNIEDRGINRAEADYLLSNDIAAVVRDLDNAIPWWRNASEARQRALANMCFQMGLKSLLGFAKMLDAYRAGEWPAVREHALDSLWARQTPERAGRVADVFYS